MSKIIAVTSGKGGVGKSTLSAGLGQAFSARGRRVLVMELDAGLRGLDIMLGVQDSVVYDLGDILSGACDIDSALISIENCAGLEMIAAPVSPQFISEERLVSLCAQLRTNYDVILIDMPAGVHTSESLIPLVADLAVVVATPDDVSVRDSNRMALLLAEKGFTSCMLVINKVNTRYRKMNMINDLDVVLDGVGVPLLGVLPEDIQIKSVFSSGLRLDRESAPADIFERIAARLDGEYQPLYIR